MNLTLTRDAILPVRPVWRPVFLIFLHFKFAQRTAKSSVLWSVPFHHRCLGRVRMLPNIKLPQQLCSQQHFHPFSNWDEGVVKAVVTSGKAKMLNCRPQEMRIVKLPRESLNQRGLWGCGDLEGSTLIVKITDLENKGSLAICRQWLKKILKT